MKLGKIHPPESLFLRRGMGEAEGNGFSFELSIGMTGSPIVQCKETQKWFSLSWQDILDLAVSRGITVPVGDPLEVELAAQAEEVATHGA